MPQVQNVRLKTLEEPLFLSERHSFNGSFRLCLFISYGDNGFYSGASSRIICYNRHPRRHTSHFNGSRDGWEIWRGNFHSACERRSVHASSRRSSSDLDHNSWVVHKRLTSRPDCVSIKEEAKRIKTAHNYSWT